MGEYTGMTKTEYKKQWRHKNPEKARAIAKRAREKHPDVIRRAHAKYTAKPEVKKRMKEKRKDIKYQALVIYGGNPPACDCCGETIVEFLTIDHINGGGGKHRKTIKGGPHIGVWLKQNDYPLGFRVLCMNCNFSLGINGYCPHKKDNQDVKVV
jgi:hypothetical protein